MRLALISLLMVPLVVGCDGEDTVDCVELVSAGAHALKGITEPVLVWVVPD